MSRKRKLLLIIAAEVSLLAGWFLPDALIRTDSSFIVSCLLSALRGILMFGVPGVLLIKRLGLPREALQETFRKPNSFDAGLTMLSAVSFVLAGSLLTSLFAMLLETLGLPVWIPAPLIPKTPADLLVASLTVSLITAICEELFFRFALVKLLTTKVSYKAASLISSGLFAALHLSLIGLPTLFLFGLFLHRLYRRKGTLLLPILFHAMYNFSILILNYADALPGISAILLSAAIFVLTARYLLKEDTDETDHPGM